MLKRRIMKVCLFTAMIAIHLCLNSFVLAEDCADKEGVTQTPTPPGNAEYAGNWRNQYGPTIYDDDMIGSGGSVNLWVDSGGAACPPYTWSTSSAGWSLDSSTTGDDLETVTLSLINTGGKTCGTDYDVYGTVTVTDDCGETDDITIRYSGGTWALVEQKYSHFPGCSGATYNCTGDVYGPVELLEGYKKWILSITVYEYQRHYPYGCNCTDMDKWSSMNWENATYPPSISPSSFYFDYLYSESCCTGRITPGTVRYRYYEWTCP